MPDPMTVKTDSPADLRARAKDWVVQIETGDASEADLREFERWLSATPQHAEAYAQAERLWRMLEAPLQAADRQCPRGGAARTRTIGRRGFIGGAIAASVVAAGGAMLFRPPLGLWPSLSELASDYRTAVGEQRKLDLAGGISVEMNTRTSLNIDTGRPDEQRIELIEGEAAVTAGATPVRVRAGGGTVAAANAQFVVRCDMAGVQVTCLAGRVDVAMGGKDADIGARQQIGYGRDLGTVVTVDPVVAAGWRDGMLVFENEPLAQVVDEINRYRPGRIVLTNAELGRRQVSARFRLARLDAVTTQFREVFGAKVTTLAGGIVIVG